MRKISVALLLCAALLVLNCCGSPSTSELPMDKPETADNVQTVDAEPVEEEEAIDQADSPAGQEENSDWQKAYWEEISQAKVAAQNAGMTEPAVAYALYDMDKDGVPELLVRVGDCEANYEGRIYSYANGGCLPLGVVGLGHGRFWTDPEGEGLIVAYGHMGICSALRIWFDEEGMQNEKLYQMDLNEQPEFSSYPTPADTVPGSVRIPEMNGYLDLPLRRYKTIMTWLDGRYESNTDEVKSPEDNPSFYEDWMDQNGIVFAVSGDGFANSPGQIPFAELLKEDVLYQYMSSDVQPGEKRIGDLNGDGVSDCLVLLNGESSDAMTILSWQNGIVYAYLFFYPPSFDAVDNNGTFLSTEYGRYAFRYLFEGEQCQRIEVPESLFVES